ncbi:MAG TPA: sigma 54-interacting transcriptional regulator, partial [Acetobacteraceae bacterium]
MNTWARHQKPGAFTVAGGIGQARSEGPIPELPEATNDIAQAAPQHLMVGDSPQMREIFDQIRRFGTTDLPVLITGESGTGKELVARAIHQRSRRASMPYIALNCAAV